MDEICQKAEVEACHDHQLLEQEEGVKQDATTCSCGCQQEKSPPCFTRHVHFKVDNVPLHITERVDNVLITKSKVDNVLITKMA